MLLPLSLYRLLEDSAPRTTAASARLNDFQMRFLLALLASAQGTGGNIIINDDDPMAQEHLFKGVKHSAGRRHHHHSAQHARHVRIPQTSRHVSG